MRWFPISVLVASGVHLVWALGLLMDTAAQRATAIHALVLVVGGTPLASTVLVVVSLLALAGSFAPSLRRTPRVLMLLPQQCVLIMSTISACDVVATGTLLDGSQKPVWYLVVAQIPIVMITAGYLLSLSRVVLTEDKNNGG